MKKEEIIEIVRKNFDAAFTEQKYYEKRTKDDAQLDRILKSFQLKRIQRCWIWVLEVDI